MMEGVLIRLYLAQLLLSLIPNLWELGDRDREEWRRARLNTLARG
jgi:hypothetical protein